MTNLEKIFFLQFRINQLDQKEKFLKQQETIRIQLIYQQTRSDFNLFRIVKTPEDLKIDAIKLNKLKQQHQINLEIFENQQKLDILRLETKDMTQLAKEIKELQEKNKTLKEKSNHLNFKI